MDFNGELLKRLTDAIGPSSREGGIRNLIIKCIEKHVDEVKVDTAGNLIARKKGIGKKLMLAAHMDQIGLMVKKIDDKGYVYFAEIGGSCPSIYHGQRVVFENGIQGVISHEGKDELEKVELDKLYIDLGAQSKEEAQKKVKIGDVCVYRSEYYENENFVFSRALDDRIGCFALIEIIRKDIESDYDLYYVFTVQEEVGLRGARTAAYGVEPDIGIAVDVTATGDTPDGEKMDIEMGKGTAIKVKDDELIASPEIKDMLIGLAEKNKIKYQMEVLEFGGTDAGAINLTRAGIKSGAVSVPTRYVHTPNEIVSKFDVMESIRLLEELIRGGSAK